MIVLKKAPQPKRETGLVPVMLTDKTMEQRRKRLLDLMKQENYDALVIYADLEHGSNFEYLAGFLPRFEEALLILFSDGSASMVLGNENLNKAGKARLPVKAVHMPHFSLPNQPMETDKTVPEILAESGIGGAKKIGLAGWKRFTSRLDDNAMLTELPHFVVEGLKAICPEAKLIHAGHLFFGDGGARTVCNANELAHYEFGAALAGQCMMDAMDAVAVGAREMDVAGYLSAGGQHHSVVSIMAAGERFVKANLYPTAKRIALGDRLSLTTGYKGGLQSRGGYAVHTAEELPEGERDWLERVAKPYFGAIAVWLEALKLGLPGGELYETVDAVLPKAEYGWTLNPGHLCADEEWLASPIYPGSRERLKSGMILQFDIIPSVPGYGGASCEGGIALADAELRAELQREYPELWQRFTERRRYMKAALGIDLPEEVLPMANASAYFRPFLLDQETVLAQE